jgi:hypothetical protein
MLQTRRVPHDPRNWPRNLRCGPTTPAQRVAARGHVACESDTTPPSLGRDLPGAGWQGRRHDRGHRGTKARPWPGGSRPGGTTHSFRNVVDGHLLSMTTQGRAVELFGAGAALGPEATASEFADTAASFGTVGALHRPISLFERCRPRQQLFGLADGWEPRWALPRADRCSARSSLESHHGEITTGQHSVRRPNPSR